jgi:hypothetical protein
MKRQFLILFTVTALSVWCTPNSAEAVGGGGHHGRGVSHGTAHGVSHGIGHGRGFGRGFGFNAFVDDGWDLAELYRELLNNVPYYALHPPVYYSYPVPRTYGYSPFAYPPHVMTPEIAGEPQPVEIINPHVPSTKSESPAEDSDRAAAVSAQPEPVVIVNPFVGPNRAVAQQ